MRITRKKQIRKTLRWYNTCFNFHAPYHCLIDLSFIEHSLQNHLNIRDQLITIFDKVTPCVTSCLLNFLKAQGSRMSGPFKVASQYYRVHCDCPSASLSGTDVIACMKRKLLEKSFILCSCDAGLRAFARGAVRLSRVTPVVTIQGQVPVLEGPSDETKKFVAEKDQDTQHVQDWEKNKIKTREQEIAEALGATSAGNQRKKKKNPNPLSVKKKAKEITKPQDDAVKKTRRGRRGGAKQQPEEI